MSKEIHISIFGEKEIPKLDLIRYYIKTHNINEVKPKEGRVAFKIDSTLFKIYEYSDTQNVRNKDITNNNLCVIIMFDMTKRKSFLDVLDKWIKFLKELKYNNKIVLFGDGKKEALAMTDEKEIRYLIKIAEINGDFFDLRTMEENDKFKLVDILIEALFNYAKNNKNKRGCNIF